MSALAIIVALASWKMPTEEPELVGFAKYMDDGVAARTAYNRGYISSPYDYEKWLEAGGFDGGVALMGWGDLGRVVTIIWPDGTHTTHISIDCAQREHYAHRIEQNDVVEVDWDVAARYEMDDPVEVKVIFGRIDDENEVYTL